jgi:hypothetical protein
LTVTEPPTAIVFSRVQTGEKTPAFGGLKGERVLLSRDLQFTSREPNGEGAQQAESEEKVRQSLHSNHVVSLVARLLSRKYQVMVPTVEASRVPSEKALSRTARGIVCGRNVTGCEVA